eukprot:RCo002618
MLSAGREPEEGLSEQLRALLQREQSELEDLLKEEHRLRRERNRAQRHLRLLSGAYRSQLGRFRGQPREKFPHLRPSVLLTAAWLTLASRLCFGAPVGSPGPPASAWLTNTN